MTNEIKGATTGNLVDVAKFTLWFAGDRHLTYYNVANRCSAAFKSVVSKPSTNCSNIDGKISLARSRCP